MSIQHRIFDKMARLSYEQALANAIRLLTGLEKKGVRIPRLSREEIGEAIRFYGMGHFLSNTSFKLGPVALTNTLTTNIFNPGTTTGGTNCTSAPFDKLYVCLTNLYLINKTAGAVTASLWIGATGANAAGTEFYVSGASVPANAMYSPPWWGFRRFGQADFLVGGAGASTSITLHGDGEIGIGA